MFKGEAFGAVRYSNFRLFLLYRFVMTLATLMQSVVVSWHVYYITKDPLWLGLIGLTEVVPQVMIALFAGHFIDLWNRKKIIAYTSLILVAGSVLLAIYAMPELHLVAKYGVLPIFITIALTGLSRGVLMPAHSAIMGQLVQRDVYANAATWNSVTWHVAAVLGPAIGGVIYGFGGALNSYIVVTALYVISFFLIVLLRNPGRIAIVTAGEGMFARIHEGFNFVFKSPVLLGAFSLDMFAVLFGGAVAMLPVFASEILHVGPEGLGVLRACPAIGAILMSGYLMYHPPVKNTGKWLFIAVTGFGLTMIGFAFSTSFTVSVVLLLLSGIFDNVSVVIRGTILQLYTPDEMRGRVAAINSIFIGSSNELGAFESGVTAKLMGLVPSVVFGGIMTLLVVGVTTKINPVLRKLSMRNRPA